MKFNEYYNAMDNINPQRELVKKYSNHGAKFKKEFQKLLELVITIKGHAWCMDVASERKKVAKLATGEFMKFVK